MGYLIHFSCTFVTGLCVGVKYSAALAATMLALTPALAFSSSYLTRRMGRLGIRSQVAYAAAGGAADQSLRARRTVAALGAERTQP